MWTIGKMQGRELALHHDSGTTLTVKYSPRCDVWLIQHPPTMMQPTITIGQGKRRRSVPDRTAAPKERKGTIERYPYMSFFHQRLLGMLGEDGTRQVLQLFLEALSKR